jgi:HD-GYP domain-containing protein (c-di-GMP phosphodiesterase class II)
LLALGLLGLAVVWLRDATPASTLSPGSLLLALGLAGAVVLAYRYPVHLRLHTKVVLASVVYYLIAVLVPPPLAVLAAGLAALAGELSQRAQSGAYLSDMVAEIGRRMLMVLIGTLVAHAGMAEPAPWLLWTIALVLAALDILTLPLVLAPIFGDRPLRVLISTARATWLVETVQYLVAVLGAVAASRYLWTLPLLIVPGALVYTAFKSMKEMHENTRLLLESMADAVDLRDPYTGGHSRRVADYSAAILRELQLTGPEVTLIVSAARVHDIGKIGVPDAVLFKPGRLMPEERALMELHPVHGANLLKRYADFARGVDIVLHHHESWDGTGYPHGLRKLDIPYGARVIAVADSFDAMTSDRPYRRGMSHEQAATILRDGRGTQWDPAIIDALLRTVATMAERDPAAQTGPLQEAPSPVAAAV